MTRVLGVDIGGTFTDFFLWEEGRLSVHKLPSTPHDPSEAVLRGLEATGLSAVHTHMTNTQNTPVEALEMAYLFRVRRYAIRRGSGGAGRHRGGDGITRRLEFLVPATVTVVAERRRRPPLGPGRRRPRRKGSHPPRERLWPQGKPTVQDPDPGGGRRQHHPR